MAKNLRTKHFATRYGGSLAILALAAVSIATAVFQTSAEPGQGRLLGVSPQESDLLDIRYPRGRALAVLPLGLPASGVGVDVNTQDATTDVAYLGRDDHSSTYRANLLTSSVAFLGSTGLGSESVNGMDFRSRDATTDAYSFPATEPSGQPAPGVLFAALNILGDPSSGADTLATINPVGGMATAIGPFGVDGVEALAFDDEGVLWAAVGAASSSTQGLYTVDLNNGLATFFVSLQNTGSNGPPGPPSGGLTALTFGCDGTLWGGSGEAVAAAAQSGDIRLGDEHEITPVGNPTTRVGGNGLGRVGNVQQARPASTDGGRLLSIDPTTGFFSYAPIPSVRQGDLGGLAFAQPCLTLFAPTPGVSNALNDLFLVGATPNARQSIFVGFGVGSSSVNVPGCGFLTLDIDDASSRDRQVADANGEATFEMFLPRGFSGRTLFFQSIDRQACTVSNLGAYTLP